MIKKIKNVTEEAVTICGQVLQPNVYYSIQEVENDKFSSCAELDALVVSEDVVVNNGTSDFTNTSLAVDYLKSPWSDIFPRTFACDMGNVDSYISGTDWQMLQGSHVLWDTDGMLDDDGDLITIKKTGVFVLDAQVRLEDLVNVLAVELAVWKKIPNGPDDYWFILRYLPVGAENTVQLSGNTQFDFYEGEQYYLAVKLYGLPLLTPTATISGNDDYTAWGASWASPL